MGVLCREVGHYPLGDDYHPPYFEHMRLLTGGYALRMTLFVLSPPLPYSLLVLAS